MIVFPNAKINLGLNITEKRSDGYHNLETLFLPVYGLTDILEVVQSTQGTSDSFNLSGIQLEGTENENIVLKALQLMRDRFDLPPVKIHLHKHIPAGAGLGGGSADAAFMLQLLNNLFQLNLKVQELKKMATLLGADCAFFIENKPSFASGIGNILTPFELNFRDRWLLIVVPPIHISTPEAYQSVIPKPATHSLKMALLKEEQEWPKLIFNDFEESVFKLQPELQKTKERLYQQGALYASLSGSGSALFGIYKTEPTFSFPADWFTWKGQI